MQVRDLFGYRTAYKKVMKGIKRLLLPTKSFAHTLIKIMAGKHLDDVELKGIKSHATVDIRPLSPVEEDQRETDSSSVIEEEEFTPHYTIGIPFAFIIIGLCLTVFVVSFRSNICVSCVADVSFHG